jgi:glutamate dehydrogenase (NAD(P)+)
MDTYSMHARHTVNAAVTGKPLALGGSSGRQEAAGRGLVFLINEAIRKFQLKPANTTAVVQGAGNVGGTAARLLAKEGYKVIAISHKQGGVYNPNGIDVDAALEHLGTRISFEGLSGVEQITNQELLELECDVLLPAATENQITSQNADHLKCRILAEGANGPTTAAADDILHRKGILIIPDILANTGGVIVSYFEWVQDRTGFFWKEELVIERLGEKIIKALDLMYQYAEKYSVDARTAAYMLAIDRVAYDTRLRGFYA